MRKKNGLFAVAIVLIVATLSGCSKLDSSFREQIVLKSGVREDANYKTYEQNKENLDDSGYIKEDPLVQQPAEDGIHVTFAKNNRIQATFFLDVSLDTPLNSSGCYIKPGDTVFATVEESDNSFYVFSGFKVYEIDAAGNRKLSKALKMSQSEGSKYELSIPDDYTGSEIAIEPVGEYKPSELVLYDFYLDNNGNKVNLNGTWKVNGKGYTSDVVTISPVSSYIVSYKYDSNEYFYVNSAPDSFYIDNDDGEITFRQINADDKKEPVYSVELQKYFSIRVVSDRERRVSVDDGPFQTIGANTELSLDHLKYGDIITILTDAPWPALDNRNDLILINSPEPLSKGEIKYTLSVPERSGTFTFNPNDYSYEHGAIVFEVNGKTVSTPQKLPKGKKIFYRQQYADPGYWLGDGEHFIVVGDETNTIRSLQEIHFIRKEGVTVFLPQPAVGGTIKYKINGRQIDNHTISTYSGTIISMTFNKWEGWQSNIAEDSVNYVVTTEGTQTANANGAPIDELFREDVEHMPALTAILEKSVGENMEVAISADGFLIESVKYGDGSSFLDWNSWNISSPSDSAPNTYNLFSDAKTIIAGQKIGTGKPIMIKISGRALQIGTAVRIVSEFIGNEKTPVHATETRYVRNLGRTLEPIYFYQPGTNATSPVWYKSAVLSIGVVDVEEYKPISDSTNIRVSLRNAETSKLYKSGDLIEPSQQVVLTISPVPGYYLTGKGVDNTTGEYYETMDFSNYQEKIENIIYTHPAEKKVVITLDISDSFACYTFKLDGQEVKPGTVSCKQGQTLEWTYEIIDPTYRFKNPVGGLFGFGGSYTKADNSIKIKNELDGQTISREYFGIDIVKEMQ